MSRAGKTCREAAASSFHQFLFCQLWSRLRHAVMLLNVYPELQRQPFTLLSLPCWILRLTTLRHAPAQTWLIHTRTWEHGSPKPLRLWASSGQWSQCKRGRSQPLLLHITLWPGSRSVEANPSLRLNFFFFYHAELLQWHVQNDSWGRMPSEINVHTEIFLSLFLRYGMRCPVSTFLLVKLQIWVIWMFFFFF